MKNIEAPYPLAPDGALVRAPGAAQIVSRGAEPPPELAAGMRDDAAPIRPVNVRLVLLLVLAFAASAIGIHFVHAWQMRRLASVFLKRSDQARAVGQTADAIAFLEQYLMFVPGDRDARIRLALTLADEARAPFQQLRVISLLEDILRRDERERPEIRERLAKIYLDLGRYADAQFHLRILLEDDPLNAQWHASLATCLEAVNDDDSAEKSLRQAINNAPREFDLYGRLGRLLSRKPDRASEAEELLNALVGRFPNEAGAALVRARHRRDHGQVEPALIDARRAWQLEPDNRDVLIFVAGLLAGQTDPDRGAPHFSALEVQRQLEQALAANPGDLDLILVAAQLDVLRDQPHRAEERLRAALQTEPHSIPLRWLLADVVLRRRDLAAAEVELEYLRGRDLLPDLVSYLEARLDMSRGDWLAARQALEAIPLSQVTVPYIRAQIHWHLAECYARLGQRERQLKSYDAALATNPSLVDVRVERAAALAGIGRIREALAGFQEVAAQPGVPLAIARLTLLETLARSSDHRDWEQVEAALNRAGAIPENEREIVLLRASMLVARDKLAEARQIVEQATRRHPEDLRLLAALAELHQVAGEPERGLELLADAERQFGRRLEIDLAHVRHWTRSEDAAAGQHLAAMAANLGRLAAEDQFVLLMALSAAQRRLGDLDAASALVEEAGRLAPENLNVWQELLDLALRAREDTQALRALKQIGHIDGEDGVNWLVGEAARLTMLARRDNAIDRDAIGRARERLTAAARKSDSTRISLALAELAELDGDEALAIEHYRQAIDRGVRSPAVFRRTVQLLYGSRRYFDAEIVIGKLRGLELVDVADAFGRLAAEVYIQANKRDEAVELARHAVTDSNDPAEHLWLGQVLWAAGQTAEAEQSLRESIRLAPERPDGWVALVTFLARSGRTADASATIDEMQRAVPERDRSLALAQCYEVIGRLDDATARYREALAAAGGDHVPVWSAASFYLRQKRFAAAEPLLRRVVDGLPPAPPGIVRAARRGLALLLALKGGQPEFREALALLDANVQVDGGTPDDLRVRAQVLATRPMLRYRREAVSALVRLADRVPLSADDQFQLIQLNIGLDNGNNWKEVRSSMQALLIGKTANPDHLAFCAGQALDHGEARGSVEGWLTTLAQLEPDSFRTAELQARRLAILGDVPAAVERLNAWRGAVTGPLEGRDVDRLRQTATAFAALAERLERSGQTVAGQQLADEAERLYRELVAGRPHHTPDLIRFLGRRWRLPEAVDLCGRSWDVVEPERLAVVCVELVRGGRLSREDVQRIRGWIAAARERHPDSAELAFQAALAANFAGAYDAAESAYRAAIERSPQAVAAYNDLAWLLAVRGRNLDEALDLINRAIELAGPLGYLLDTRATIHLARKQPRLAIRDAEDAVEERETAGRKFRLAQAHLAAGDAGSARLEWQDAVALGLHTAVLHPLELPEFQELRSTFGTQ